MNIKEKIGIRLKELRNEKGLTQEMCSQICKVGRSYIAKVEHGKSNISVENIEKIAKGFDISIPQFFSGGLFN